MLGVEKSLEVISDVKELVVDAVGLIKGGSFSFLKLGSLFKVASDIQELVVDAKGALPELAELDASEAGKLTEAAYSAVKEIVASLAVK